MKKPDNPDLMDLFRIINSKTFFKVKKYKINKDGSLKMSLKYYNGELK